MNGLVFCAICLAPIIFLTFFTVTMKGSTPDVKIDTKNRKVDTKHVSPEFIEDDRKSILDVDRMHALSQIENRYETCCGKATDRRLLEFGAKCMALFSILLFSFFMVLRGDSNQHIYINVILIVMSVFIPSPGIDAMKQH